MVRDKKAARRLLFYFAWLRGLDLNQRPSGYAYHYDFHRSRYYIEICSLDYTLSRI